MSTEKCQNKNPLRLKGIAQEKRFPLALDPDWVKIDGKEVADYQRIAKEFAELIQFYSTLNLRDEDWQVFFNDAAFTAETPSSHIALFNAFVLLIKYAQDDLNEITAKHLEFYYKDVLQIGLKEAVPDAVHLLFGLTNNIKSHLVKEGTLLRAGKDLNGKQLLFKTKSDLVVNRTEIAELKSLFVQTDSDSNQKLVYAAPIANSADGNGAEIDSENPKWAQFGQEQKDLVGQTMNLASFGVAIASDFLLLKEGQRVLTVAFNYTAVTVAPVIAAEDFKLYLSGEKEWIEVRPTAASATINALTISFTLGAEIEAVIGYQESVFLEQFKTDLPVLKVVINQRADKDVFGQLVALKLISVDLSADVSEIKELVLQNESGVLDPTKPFEPFGSRPAIGSEFYIGNREVFSKKLSSLNLGVIWHNKPDFAEKYAVYTEGTDAVEDHDFKVAIHGLKNRAWSLIEEEVELFDEDDEINLDAASVSAFFPEPDPVKEFTELTHQQVNGFIKLELTSPNGTPFKAFGHDKYQNLYVTNATKIARGDSVATLPEEPYTPKIKAFKMGYSASVSLPLSAANQSFFHIGAFGVADRSGLVGNDLNFLPNYEDEGNFYIGLINAELPQNINLLFQISDGSSDPNKLPADVKWSMLINNNWEEFTTNLISDSTNGFINSGIIEIQLPSELEKDNTWMTPDRYWLRASMSIDTDSVCQLVNVHTQAITAVFADNKNELSHLEEALPANTIAKLNESQSVIKKVEQPYASFNGKLPEEGNDYYRRVSERLRHKNRPITIWDYERLILEEFPSVYKIKCLNHTRMNAYYSEQAPGNVSLIIVSNLRNQNAINPLQPTTSIAKLTAITTFLEEIKDPFVQLHVKNPDFEEVRVEFNVKFHVGFDQGYYQDQLNSDLKQYLSPWAYAEGEDISFEGVIHKSKIINFVEELNYVDYLTCFKMYHVIDGNSAGLEDVNEIEPTKSSALIVSHTQHLITVLTTDECECDVNNVQAVVISGGIGAMTINDDFSVNKV